MAKKTIEYPRIDYIRAGDWVEVTFFSSDDVLGHPFSGLAWQPSIDKGTDRLLVGTTVIRNEVGQVGVGIEITSLTRVIPDLPVEPGTVARANVRGVPNVRIMRQDNDSWVSSEKIKDEYHHYDNNIGHEDFVLILEGN